MGASEQGSDGSGHTTAPGCAPPFQFLWGEWRGWGQETSRRALTETSTRNSQQCIHSFINQATGNRRHIQTRTLGFIKGLGDCDGLDCVPLNSYAEVPTPSTCECNRIWRYGYLKR